MSDAYLVKPDKEFAQEIMQLGGESLQKCFQCATCSVACELSPERHPFPRKEMLWAQWGLKDKLLGDPDVWLCYRCNDCSVRCPRGAAPGDVMAAVRDHSIQHYAFPRFLGRALRRPGILPLLLGMPAVLLLIAILAFGDLMPEGEVEYSRFFPHGALITFFTAFTLFATIAIVVGVARFWKDLERQAPAGPRGSLVASIKGAVKEILTHRQFRDCNDRRSRSWSHLLTFYGFVGLFFVTGAVVVSTYLFDYYPIDWWHPLKWIGNFSALVIFLGLTWILADRLGKREKAEKSTISDWSFVWILYLVVVTGIITEILRFADIAALAYPLYFVHMVVVFFLLIYVAHTRFAHMIYRTVAIVHANYSGRKDGMEQEQQG
jgi:quinone-modifying oxidoreductase subunit QmoC